MKNKKIASVLAIAGLATGLGFVSAAPASATAACTTNGYGVTRSGNILAVPATAGGSLQCHLQLGYYGNTAVWYLQYSIAWCYRGYGEAVLNIAVDGNYGPKTMAAVKRVQQIERITADGVYGPQTRDAMMHRQDPWEGDQDPNICRKLSW
jgi:peptidoglycan hydrolase-like protein with peptidoglycan-binding domain